MTPTGWILVVIVLVTVHLPRLWHFARTGERSATSYDLVVLALASVLTASVWTIDVRGVGDWRAVATSLEVVLVTLNVLAWCRTRRRVVPGRNGRQ